MRSLYRQHRRYRLSVSDVNRAKRSKAKVKAKAEVLGFESKAIAKSKVNFFNFFLLQSKGEIKLIYKVDYTQQLTSHCHLSLKFARVTESPKDVFTLIELRKTLCNTVYCHAGLEKT